MIREVTVTITVPSDRLADLQDFCLEVAADSGAALPTAAPAEGLADKPKRGRPRGSRNKKAKDEPAPAAPASSFPPAGVTGSIHNPPPWPTPAPGLISWPQQPQPQQPQPQQPQPQPQVMPPGGVVSEEQFRTEVFELLSRMGVAGMSTAQAVFQKHGATQLSEVKPESRAAIVAELRSLQPRT